MFYKILTIFLSMQRLSLLFVFLVTNIWLNAQEIPVETFYRSMTDVSASIDPRTDYNGNYCALIKVESNWKDIIFEGNVGEVIYQNGVHWVYMPSGSKKLRMSIESYLPKTIDFSEFKIKKLESKATYVLKVPISKTYETEIIKKQIIKKELITVADTVHKVVTHKVYGGTEYYTVPSYFSIHAGVGFVRGSEKACYEGIYKNKMPRIGVDYTWVLNHFLSFRIGLNGGIRLPLYQDEEDDDYSEISMQPYVDIPLMIGLYKAFGYDCQNEISVHLGYIPNVEFEGLDDINGEALWQSGYGLELRLGLNKLMIGSSFVFGNEMNHCSIHIGFRF